MYHPLPVMDGESPGCSRQQWRMETEPEPVLHGGVAGQWKRQRGGGGHIHHQSLQEVRSTSQK